ncbi:hypothetical protein SEA_EVAA_75 [Gordonia phage Evaa]|nr:hypothetical protein SEA_EVAA_75 [Gordonia phage Evaa]
MTEDEAVEAVLDAFFEGKLTLGDLEAMGDE